MALTDTKIRLAKSKEKAYKNLYEAFAEMRPEYITPVHIYQYIDARAKKAGTRANREKALLSHVFSMAIRWGIVIDNPCKNVKRIPEKKRNHYITHEDYE